MTSRIRRHHSNELSTIPKTDHHEMGIGRTRDHLYDPNQKSRTKNWKGELQLAFAIMISAVSFLVGRHTMIHDERSVQPPHGAAVRSAVTPSLHQIGEKGATTNICPSALKLFTNKTKLELAIESNIHFHQHGGNLHSIEQYLNSHMQSTLDRLGVQFTPGKSNNPVPDAIGHLNVNHFQGVSIQLLIMDGYSNKPSLKNDGLMYWSLRREIASGQGLDHWARSVRSLLRFQREVMKRRIYVLRRRLTVMENNVKMEITRKNAILYQSDRMINGDSRRK